MHQQQPQDMHSYMLQESLRVAADWSGSLYKKLAATSSSVMQGCSPSEAGQVFWCRNDYAVSANTEQAR